MMTASIQAFYVMILRDDCQYTGFLRDDCQYTGFLRDDFT